jgi:hypothetical protein
MARERQHGCHHRHQPEHPPKENTMNAIRPIATLLATAALATLPLTASAHKDNAKHDHGTDAHARCPKASTRF